jgi:uncharacterized protein (UPF0210 family)
MTAENDYATRAEVRALHEASTAMTAAVETKLDVTFSAVDGRLKKIEETGERTASAVERLANDESRRSSSERTTRAIESEHKADRRAQVAIVGTLVAILGTLVVIAATVSSLS